MKIEDNNFESENFSCETTMNRLEVDFLISKLKKSRNYLEYGSGFSTVEASKYVKEKIFSVETNLEFVHFMKFKLAQEELNIPKITFLHSHVGETRDWGFPVDFSSIGNWPKYGSLDSETFNEEEFTPDLSLIDGRFRISTFARLYLAYPGLKVIFDDYVDRPQYHVVETFAQPKFHIGRIAFFEIPRIRSNRKIKLATDIVLNNILNPE